MALALYTEYLLDILQVSLLPLHLEVHLVFSLILESGLIVLITSLVSLLLLLRLLTRHLFLILLYLVVAVEVTVEDHVVVILLYEGLQVVVSAHEGSKFVRGPIVRDFVGLYTFLDEHCREEFFAHSETLHGGVHVEI